ncbi:MAG TPA: hypothetical protein VHV10_00280, partial [Ktedonobacteraceae bacterium]|nr:hypothetical protein [Ktedonobacteraceae bacterium]
ILCGNNSCTNVNVGGNTNDCGGSAGQGLAYNRFGCKMMDSGTQFVGRNWNDPNSNDQSKQFFGTGTLDWNWHSTGIAINPTAFDPTGALYLPTYNLRAIDIDPTQDTPTCPNNKEWTCPNNENIVLYQYQGNFSKNHDGLYEQALPSTSNAPQQTAKKDISKVSGNGGIDGYTPGGQPIPLFWVACDAMGAGWAFPCSDKAGQDGEMPGVNFNVGQSLDEDTVSESIIVKDWLSGDSNPKADSDPNVPAEQQSGHLLHTYLQDTILQPKVHQLYGLTLGLGYVLISPIIVLLGYQMLWASWTFRYAGLMDTIPRLILSMVTVGISYDMASTLIGLTNLFNSAIITLHISIPYIPIQINGQDYTFTLAHQGETDAASFRAIVVPISRWGCIANDFVAILSTKFWTDVSGFLPMIGGMLKFAENIPNMIDFAKHIGEFLMLIMSVMLCVQAFVRIILLNYYILVGPVVFACWGLPGGMGNNVVRQWAKGFASLLFVQTVQIFVLTTLPLIMPTFPTLPTDTFGLINVLLGQLPRVIVVVATVQVPKMMGTQATRAIAQAGTVAGGAVAAAGAAAYSTV